MITKSLLICIATTSLFLAGCTETTKVLPTSKNFVDEFQNDDVRKKFKNTSGDSIDLNLLLSANEEYRKVFEQRSGRNANTNIVLNATAIAAVMAVGLSNPGSFSSGDTTSVVVGALGFDQMTGLFNAPVNQIAFDKAAREAACFGIIIQAAKNKQDKNRTLTDKDLTPAQVIRVMNESHSNLMLRISRERLRIIDLFAIWDSREDVADKLKNEELITERNKNIAVGAVADSDFEKMGECLL
ncbi:MAG: hypothetical protein AAF198_10840 [Pseudomonadota bacterium]